MMCNSSCLFVDISLKSMLQNMSWKKSSESANNHFKGWLMSDENERGVKLEQVAEIVSAYVSNNSVPADQIGDLITSVHDSLMNVGEKPAETLKPAVPIKQSVKPDYIVCLEDGKKLKMLKRHLKVSFNLTPDEYREKWGLPKDYPVVAPNYAVQRSELARKIGLGKGTTRRRARKKAAA